MYKTKIMMPSADAISMIIQRKQMPFTGEYDTMKLTTLRMDYPYAHVLKYYSFSYVPASVPQ